MLKTKVDKRSVTEDEAKRFGYSFYLDSSGDLDVNIWRTPMSLTLGSDTFHGQLYIISTQTKGGFTLQFSCDPSDVFSVSDKGFPSLAKGLSFSVDEAICSEVVKSINHLNWENFFYLIYDYVTWKEPYDSYIRSIFHSEDPYIQLGVLDEIYVTIYYLYRFSPQIALCYGKKDQIGVFHFRWNRDGLGSWNNHRPEEAVYYTFRDRSRVIFIDTDFMELPNLRSNIFNRKYLLSVCEKIMDDYVRSQPYGKYLEL